MKFRDEKNDIVSDEVKEASKDFLNSLIDAVYLSEEERRDLRVKITENGTKGENPFRLIEYIDRVETQKKIQYLVNATRCLLADFIDIATYFRICHAATYTLDEDLQFLKTHIEKK